MKKLYLGMIVASASLFAACNSDSEYSTNYQFKTTNLVTDLHTGESEAKSGVYDIHLNYTDEIATISCSDLTFGKANFNFASENTKFGNYIYSLDGYQGQLIMIDSFKGSAYSNQNYAVEGKNFAISFLNFYNSKEPGENTLAAYNPAIVTQYTLGDDYSVKTFSADAVYAGKTITSYPNRTTGETMTYENETMTYRFNIDILKDKATMIIYNARFAETMPIELEAIVVEGLDVAWKSGTYEITGKDIIPTYYEGETQTPMPAFIFKYVNFAPSNESLTQATLTYDVADSYSAVFNGSYLIEPTLNK